MAEFYIEDKTFESEDFTAEASLVREYENCTFINCDFSNADLARIIFSDCDFTACNLSMAKLGSTSFRDVRFRDSKLLGLRFDHCNDFLFAVNFANCMLNLASFYRMKIKGTNFKDCAMRETDFTGSDLTGAKFDNCDLLKAAFDGSILEKADLRTAYNYSFDPELNRIKKARFSREGLAGLLVKYDIEIE